TIFRSPGAFSFCRRARSSAILWARKFASTLIPIDLPFGAHEISMKAPAAISVAYFGIRLRPIRLAEFFMLALLAVLTGLPPVFSVARGLLLFFLLVGSFNLAPPGKEAVYGIANWVRAFSDPGTVSALWMSFLIAVVRLIPAMILSTVVAWLIARTDMPGRNAFEFLCWF